MTNVQVVLIAVLILTATSLASGHSVVSTHSGLVYFFEGSVFIGDQQLEQKLARFPNVGEGHELRTERGRAEVLLTPGVVLRLDENSAIRMLSDKLSNTLVELLCGSAILGSNREASDTSSSLIYRNWRVQVPRQGVYRIDFEPWLRVFKGQVEVSTDGRTGAKTVGEGEVLSFATVLVAEPATAAEEGGFKTWAIARGPAISADNAIGAKIVDDPNPMNTDGLDFRGVRGNTFPSSKRNRRCGKGATWHWCCDAELGSFALGVIVYGLSPRVARHTQCLLRIRLPRLGQQFRRWVRFSLTESEPRGENITTVRVPGARRTTGFRRRIHDATESLSPIQPWAEAEFKQHTENMAEGFFDTC
jgi:hypothetical protein